VTWLSACGWTLLRSMLLTLLAWPVSATLAEHLRNVPGPRRSLGLALVLLPFLFPELVTGYAYAPWVAGLPWPAEGLCCLLLWLRIIPIGAVTLMIAPPAGVSASAWHLRSLLRGTGRTLGSPVRWIWERSVRRSIPALGLMWFVLFQEFELAALLKTVSWADWLFVAQVGGLPLSTSWRLAMLPLLGELAVLLPIIVLITRSAGGWSREIPSPPRPSVRWLCRGYLVVAILLVCIVPVGLLLRTSWSALTAHLLQRLQWSGLGRELVGGAGVATCAGGLAWWLADQIRPRSAWSSGWLWLVPGCCGSLVVGLTLVNLFQRGGLHVVYDTPIPWILGLTMILLPRAALLQVWLQRMRPGSPVHAARMAAAMAGRNAASRVLVWRLEHQPTCLAVGLVCWWGYLDVTIAYLLNPTGMVPGIVRLYNFMHYGRSAALSAEAAVLLLTPLAVVSAALALAPHLSGLFAVPPRTAAPSNPQSPMGPESA
jgi:hypothetical protein